jgi:hypothetical protein
VCSARVFSEDKRRVDDLHLGTGHSTGAAHVVGRPAARKRDAGSTKKNLRSARLWKQSGSTAREGALWQRCLGSGTRGDRSTRVCSRVGDTAASSLSTFSPALNTQGSERIGSPIRNRGVRGGRRERRLGLTRSQRPFTRRGGGSLGSRDRPEDRRKTICGPTPADAIALCREAREATRRQRYAHGCDRRRQRSGGPMRSPKWTARRESSVPALRGETRRGVHRDREQSFFEKRIVSCRRRSNGPRSPEGRAPREPEGTAQDRAVASPIHAAGKVA